MNNKKKKQEKQEQLQHAAQQAEQNTKSLNLRLKRLAQTVAIKAESNLDRTRAQTASSALRTEISGFFFVLGFGRCGGVWFFSMLFFFAFGVFCVKMIILCVCVCVEMSHFSNVFFFLHVVGWGNRGGNLEKSFAEKMSHDIHGFTDEQV